MLRLSSESEALYYGASHLTTGQGTLPRLPSHNADVAQLVDLPAYAQAHVTQLVE